MKRSHAIVKYLLLWGLTSGMGVLYSTLMSSEHQHDIGEEGLLSTELVDDGLPDENRLVRVEIIVGKNPEAEWTRQLKMLSGRYAQDLGATPEEYERELETLKEDFLNKAKDVEDLSDLVIVETRIALPKMLEKAHIGTFFDPQKEEVEDWLGEGGFETPKKPYVTHLTYAPNKSINDIRVDSLKAGNKRGGTIFDGIARYQKDPRILNKFFLQFPGSQVGLDDCPFLFVFSDNNPLLSYGKVESASPKFACVIAST